MRQLFSILIACFILAVSSPARGAILNGDIVYLDATAECRAGTYKPNCYFQSESAARKVVGQFARLDIKNYLLPVVDSYGTDLNPYLVFYSALKDTGGGFFLQETTPWVSVGKNCAAYLKSRQHKLHRLNQLTGRAFLGFADDEPELSDFESTHVGMKECLQSVPEFKNKLWLTNIFPILTGASQLYAVKGNKPYTLADFGGCKMKNLPNIESIYASYADTVFGKMRPDIGSFDLYPFNKISRGCKDATRRLLETNLNILLQDREKYGFTTATYLQASQSIYADVATPRQIAMSRKMAENRGITIFLYFLSHSTDRQAEVVINGMLDENNEPTQIFLNHLKARAYQAERK